MSYSPEKRHLMQQGFIDGLERRDLPLPEYTKDEVKEWRKGHLDGRDFARFFWVPYHDEQKRENLDAERSPLVAGFLIGAAGVKGASSGFTADDKDDWLRGRRKGKLFREVYQDSYHCWLILDDLKELLFEKLLAEHDESLSEAQG